jgi:hypothetical protein
MVLVQRVPRALVAFLVFVGIRLPAQNSCDTGTPRVNFGYEYIACPGCFRSIIVNGQTYTGFTAPPILHNVAPKGPAAGKLMDDDTLVAIDSLSILSDQGAIRLATAVGRTTLTVRRAGKILTLMIDPILTCWHPMSREQMQEAIALLMGPLKAARRVTLDSMQRAKTDSTTQQSSGRARLVGDTVWILPNPQRWTVGTAAVEVHGGRVSVSRDEHTGALTLRIGGDTIVIRPPNR